MELVQLILDSLKKINPELLVGLFTGLIAFFSWIVKGLIEKPLLSSKETFNHFTEKRIEVLAEIKTRLIFISYFPNEDGKEFKEELQAIIMKDGKVGYLNKDLLASVIKIAIDEHTNETLLLSTINEIDIDLTKQISKIQDEIIFYNKFSNLNPAKRIIGFLLLAIEYIITLAIIFLILYNLYYLLSITKSYVRIIILFDCLLLLILINKWFKR